MMRGGIKRHLPNIIFIMICLLAIYFLPYILTAEYYTTEKTKIASHFPIAFQDKNEAYIITWDEYQNRHPDFTLTLLTPEQKHTYHLKNQEEFTLTPRGSHTYQVTYDTDYATFWSEYSVLNNQIQPISYRNNNAGMLFPALILGLLGRSICNYLLSRQKKKL